MDKIFNSVFEFKLHVLMLLNMYNKSVSAEIITYIDFITVYSKSFNIGENNLNGDNEFMHGEISSRRFQIKVALKSLVLEGLVKAQIINDCWQYSITDAGRQYEKLLNAEYAIKYRDEVEVVISELLGMNEWELDLFIKENSIA